ncbi:MAG: hypothetical protein IH594_11710, partial [Bacteroidales bacterium]|nr:hypothetical protein [Bacteroidales bacterium]
MRRYPIPFSIVFFFIIIFTAGCSGKNEIKFKETEEGLIVAGGKIKAYFNWDKDSLSDQIFFIKDTSQKYREVLRSFRPVIDDSLRLSSDSDYARLYDTGLSARRYLLTEQASKMTYDKKTGVVTLEGGNEEFRYKQSVSVIPEENRIHYSVECFLPDSSLDYVLSTFTFNCDQPPFFVHTPALKYDNEESGQNRFRLVPSQDQIIGDRAFYA